LRISEGRLRLAMEAAGLGTWDEDLHSRQSVWNEQAFRIFDYEPQTTTVTPDRWLSCVLPEDRARVSEAYAKAFVDNSLYECEHRIMRAEGAVRWVAPYGRILLDAEGQACRFAGVFRDITEQKQAQEALRKSEERLRLAQSNTGVGIFDWDLQTQALYWSPELEALDGLPPGSMQCIEDFRRRVHPEDLAAADSSRDAAIQGHQQSYEEFRIIRPDG
jgi:PAS domain S-box-containing protein